MSERPKAVILLSGGVDSATCLAIALANGYEPYGLSFNYHQRHAVELAAASQVAAFFGVSQHLVLDIPLGKIGGSALTTSMDVPKDVPADLIGRAIPITYVPARNTIFLSFALAFAEVVSAGDIFIGVNAMDYSGYPDCRPDYIAAFEKMANLAVQKAVEGQLVFRIRTPLLHLNKAQIIKKGLELGVDFALTHSCYDPDPTGLACGRCESCISGEKDSPRPEPRIRRATLRDASETRRSPPCLY